MRKIANKYGYMTAINRLIDRGLPVPKKGEQHQQQQPIAHGEY